MKRILMIKAVAGLVTLAAAGTAISSVCEKAPEKISVAAAPEIVIGMQSNDGSFYVIRLETADAVIPCPDAASMRLDILQQMPDLKTLILLGLGGLLYSRRKQEQIRPAHLPVI